MKLTEQHDDGFMFWHLWKMLSNLKLGTKKIVLTHSVVLPTNPEWSIARAKTERLSTFVHCKATITPDLFSLRQTVELERTHLPHGQLFQLLIKPGERSMGRRIESKKHAQRLFSLTFESARLVTETANDRLDRTR